MKTFLFSFSFFLFGLHLSTAQSISLQITDANTAESIPFANIKVNNTTHLISNAEGYCTLSEKFNADATQVVVSYLGYVPAEITLGELKANEYKVKLVPAIVELETLTIKNERPNADSIMAAVRKNLKVHYKGNGLAFKDQLFTRNSSGFVPKKVDITVDKSTGFSKEQLKTTNADLKIFGDKLIKQPPFGFKDLLCHYYTTLTTKNDKPLFISKLEAVKAASLRNSEQAVSLEDMNEMVEKTFLKHLDPNKFYRLKSGLFGSRDTISLKEGIHDKNSKAKPETTLSKARTDMMTTLYRNNFMQSEKFDFLSQLEYYTYTYEGKTYKSDEDYVYIIRFTPDKSKAKYTGKLYISATDYAVVRCDYTLAEGKTLNSFNMKFLLGVKSSENVSKGTIIYKKNPVGTGYYLQYASMETGQYIYLNRPLKFIELTDAEKDVVSFNLKIEGNMVKKTELLNLNREETSNAVVEQFKENDFNYTPLKRYDPAFWKEYSVIEPLEAMKQLKAEE
ncbi:carboxypeptidase-like regulatory domain-containing protein [Flavobacterium silvisoli]|uniref:Carboxypeptidase-like regulatory domain-containing protein n=1 Tax=Flavobacterium silvisoli TaxID=2529433 RepID=A0A4Q9Z840_9FLAO|nr:carboxypeptidase-like regulatory domain-containing protein [Flavobacterium silvisoli]TBX70279.1 carboxypeptidase-like regulatory domain-containing protein [Flavobacterium silvisoli]